MNRIEPQRICAPPRPNRMEKSTTSISETLITFNKIKYELRTIEEKLSSISRNNGPPPSSGEPPPLLQGTTEQEEQETPDSHIRTGRTRRITKSGITKTPKISETKSTKSRPNRATLL
ncbi:hypothetical protein Dimus_021563 [Dionaea muscipula]